MPTAMEVIMAMKIAVSIKYKVLYIYWIVTSMAKEYDFQKGILLPFAFGELRPSRASGCLSLL